MTSAQKHPPRNYTHRTDAAWNTTPRSRSRALIVLAAALGLALAGCGTSGGSGATTSGAAPTGASASTTAGGTPSAMESTMPATPAPTTPPPRTAAPATPATPALCTAAALAGSLDDTGGGAAGHIYMKLILKNKSATTCILDGYPGVSLVKAGSTKAIGAPADRDATAPSKGPITLTPGKGATAVLAYTQAGNYPECTRVQADDIMVYPPSAYDELMIPHPLTACSNADIKLLKIGAFQP